MKSVREALSRTKSELDRASIPSSRRIAEELLSSILHISRMELYLQFDRTVGNLEWRKIQRLIDRHVGGEPIEYVLQTLDFYGNRLEISSDVLIPRPETELLVEKVSARVTEKPAGRMLDLCAGSGCIGLGLKRAHPDLTVILSDVSEKAVRVARDNARRNRLSVGIACGDLLSPFQGERFDYVVCNPPYISEKDYIGLDRSVREFEPRLALVGGRTGLEFYERLERELPRHLNSGAKVFFEIGYDQGEALSNIFGASYWRLVSCEKDWAGHDRFFFLEFQ